MCKSIKSIVKNCDNNNLTKIFPYFTIIPGKSNVIISAPHTNSHKRNDKIKKRDKQTLTLAKMLSELTQAHVIFTNKAIPFDPNFDKLNDYQLELIKYVQKNDIEYLIDLHGTKMTKYVDIEIGTNNLKNIDKDEDLLNEVVRIFKDNKFNKIRIDKKFKGSKNTICKMIHKKTRIKTLQFEISKKYRSISEDISSYRLILNALICVTQYLERRDKMNDINYVEKYDKLLEIKPSYGYKRSLGIINYNQIGLEIEISVNFTRNSYSFIRKMLKKVKDLVAERGYFVKDGTVLGDYSFEIVLDPLTIPDIIEFYTKLYEIIDFSQGTLEITKEKNCGIHINFNKNDIENINESHKRITTFAKENPSYFDENMYKQFKFIWEFEKYDKYQKEVGDKYLWVNYIKSKVVEIRNMKAEIRPAELERVLKGFLDALYFDKEEGVIPSKTFMKLDKIYDTAFDSLQTEEAFNSIDKNDFVIIGLKDAKGKIINLSEELISQIKALI